MLSLSCSLPPLPPLPPLPSWYAGRDDIRAFLAGRVFALKWRFVPLRASGQPSMAAYQWIAESCTYRLEVINVFTLRADHVSAITSFLAREAIDRFRLPLYLPELS
jgi:hypothetical protein